ncbi:Uncharacterized protein TCM_022351 [Theobroma cacao]|uniref:Uncharacterized protein n=1 Tax=Theobroma cacao TaxID=3641 RepID=A0A061ETN6_THECC|nr:Uncharacterized protein TCM_022351 [Theobroma cacao]
MSPVPRMALSSSTWMVRLLENQVPATVGGALHDHTGRILGVLAINIGIEELNYAKILCHKKRVSFSSYPPNVQTPMRSL